MPLRPGRSKAIISQTIKEALESYKKTGKFGNSRPKDLAHARRQIIAAAYAKAGLGRA